MYSDSLPVLCSIEFSCDEGQLLGSLLQLPFALTVLQDTCQDSLSSGQEDRFLHAKTSLLERKWIALREDGLVAIQEDVAFFLYALEASEHIVILQNGREHSTCYLYQAENIWLEQKIIGKDRLSLVIWQSIDQLFPRMLDFLAIYPGAAGLQEISMPFSAWDQIWSMAQTPSKDIATALGLLRSLEIAPETVQEVVTALFFNTQWGESAIFARQDVFTLQEINRLSWFQSAEQGWCIHWPLDDSAIRLLPASGKMIKASIDGGLQCIFQKS